jgi:hypothetical protein
MKPSSRWKKGLFCLAFLLNIMAAGNAVAGETTKEFWPEVDTWLRFSPD